MKDLKKGAKVWWMAVVKDKSTKLEGELISMKDSKWAVAMHVGPKSKNKEGGVVFVTPSKLHLV